MRFFQSQQETGVRWITYKEPEISSNIIWGLTCENVVNGDVWVATPLFGVDRFTPSAADPRYGSWRNYTATDVPAFRSNQIYAVSMNIVDYSIWVSSTFSLVVLLDDVRGWRSYTPSPQYDYTVISLATDLSNTIWMGRREGASKLDR